jgi:hypothetical protein
VDLVQAAVDVPAQSACLGISTYVASADTIDVTAAVANAADSDRVTISPVGLENLGQGW